MYYKDIMSELSQKLANLSNNPGCYIFKNQSGKIVYIGKAKNLKKRVASYFRKDVIDSKTKELVAEVFDIDFIVTDSELEALLLEAKLIKENQPKYNIKLKGGIRYAYIKITDEQFPRLESARLFKRKDKIFGPFALSDTRRNLIKLANFLFKLRVGKQSPVKVGEFYQIQCSTAPWRRLVTEAEYKNNVANAELFLKGQNTELIRRLTSEMKNFSADKEFELAKIRRDQIVALNNLSEKQKVQLKKSYDQDVINYVRTVNKFIVQLFNINKGVVSGRKEFRWPPTSSKISDEEMISDFLTQYYYSNEIPQEVIIPCRLENEKILEKYLTKLSGRKTRIAIPQKGQNVRLLELVKKNILVSLKRGDTALLELQNKLNLPNLPVVIECFDVSNLGESYIVGSMVYFKNGLPDKNNYRHFRIKWQKKQSDFDAMREIIFRRYYRLVLEKSLLPNLILVDGGKPQLTAARLALKSLGVSAPIAALAKKEEELFTLGQKESIKLDRKSAALKLVQKIRDEAHRFAITYHRLLRSKSIR